MRTFGCFNDMIRWLINELKTPDNWELLQNNDYSKSATVYLNHIASTDLVVIIDFTSDYKRFIKLCFSLRDKNTLDYASVHRFNFNDFYEIRPPKIFSKEHFFKSSEYKTILAFNKSILGRLTNLQSYNREIANRKAQATIVNQVNDLFQDVPDKDDIIICP